MAEQIVNEFTVNRPIDEAWPVICDLERIAPCLPGAQLEEIEGEIHRGNVKVKLGAITTQFRGEAHMVERDDVNHKAALKASGRDTKGRGNASADITAEAVALSPTSTKCTVVADLHITGKVAQFSRGILGDVSKKLINQFANNLNTMLDESNVAETAPAETAAPADAEPSAAEAAPSVEPITDAPADTTTDTSVADSAPAAPPAAASTDTAAAAAPAATTTPDSTGPTVRRIEGPASEPVEIAGLAGPAVAKRAVPIVVVVLLLLLLLRRRGR